MNTETLNGKVVKRMLVKSQNSFVLILIYITYVTLNKSLNLQNSSWHLLRLYHIQDFVKPQTFFVKWRWCLINYLENFCKGPYT